MGSWTSYLAMSQLSSWTSQRMNGGYIASNIVHVFLSFLHFLAFCCHSSINSLYVLVLEHGLEKHCQMMLVHSRPHFHPMWV